MRAIERALRVENFSFVFTCRIFLTMLYGCIFEKGSVEVQCFFSFSKVGIGKEETGGDIGGCFASFLKHNLPVETIFV